MQILKKQLFTFQAILALLLLVSCSTPQYTYYYSVLKQNDNQINNFKKDIWNGYSRFPIQNSINDTAIGNDAILYFLDISEKYVAISIQRKIPIFIDCEKSFISINQSKHSLLNNHFAWIEYKDRLDTIKNILTFNSNYRGIDTFCKTSSFDSFIKYENYDTVDVDEIRNYTIGNMKKYENTKYQSENYSSLYYKPFTIDLPVIKFTRENTPLKIGIDLVYYTDSACNDKHEVKAEFYQSELMILKNIRLDVQRKDQNCYYKGEIIGLEVNDISFYTERKTGTVFGWPEIRLGLGKTSYWILYPVFIPIEIVWGIRNAGDGRPVFPYPLFE